MSEWTVLLGTVRVCRAAVRRGDGPAVFASIGLIEAALAVVAARLAADAKLIQQ